MKKINFNKIFFMFLCSISISLGTFASAISLLTKNIFLQTMLLTLTFFSGILLVNARRKYQIIIKSSK